MLRVAIETSRIHKTETFKVIVELTDEQLKRIESDIDTVEDVKKSPQDVLRRYIQMNSIDQYEFVLNEGKAIGMETVYEVLDN